MSVGTILSATFNFEEVRLAPVAACRAWTAAHGCFSAFEWNARILELPVWRQGFEFARLQISEVLSVDGIDSLGIVRALLIHESTAGLSRSWLREVGFVHLEAASGIHLYCIWRSLGFFLRNLADRFRFSLPLQWFLRLLIPLVIWFVLFALAGFRPGLVRPLVLVGLRLASDRFGIRWRGGVPLFAALGVDAAFGFYRAYGSDSTFAEWAPGELHYALSWWGGIYGYEWAREKGLGSFASHAALGFFSWIAVLPLDLYDGRFAPATPLLSLLTVEFFVRGGYALFVVLALAVGFVAVPEVRDHASTALEWVSLGWNSGVADIAAGITRFGGMRAW